MLPQAIFNIASDYVRGTTSTVANNVTGMLHVSGDAGHID